jgi:hypothetical protein
MKIWIDAQLMNPSVGKNGDIRIRDLEWGKP